MTTDNMVPFASGVSIGEHIGPAIAGGAKAVDLTTPGQKTELFGRVEAVYFEKRCLTCQDPERPYIERRFLAGDSAPAIERSLNRSFDDEHMRTKGKKRANARSILRHIDGNHLPRHTMMALAAIAARANEMGIDREVFVGNMMNLATFAKMGIGHVIDRFVRGEMPEMGWQEFATFANIHMKQEQLLAATDTQDVDMVTEMIDVILTTANGIMTLDQRTDFTRQVSAHPTIAGFKVRSEGQKMAMREEMRNELMAELEAGVDRDEEDI